MKVKVLANELLDSNIEFVSLVKHGAIRSPFKILKADELPTGTEMTVTKRLAQMFTGKETSGEAQVCAILVKNERVEALEPIIKDAGFSVETSVVEGPVTVFKQNGFTENLGSCIALSDDVGVMLSSVVKEFYPFPMTTSFDENVAAASFFPSLHNAMDSLSETIWQVLNENGASTETAQKQVAKTVDAFGQHVKALVKTLPASVFKMEMGIRSLNPPIEGSTLPGTDGETKTPEGEEMKPVLKEAVAGDLDGLNLNEPVKKQEAAPAVEVTEPAAAAAAPEAPVETVEKAEPLKGTKKVKKGDQIVDVEYTYELAEDGSEVFLGFIEKAEAPKEQSEAAPEAQSAAQPSAELTALMKTVEALAATVGKLTESKNLSVPANPSKVVVATAGEDLDESLSGMGVGRDRTVRKGDGGGADDQWSGVLTIFDR